MSLSAAARVARGQDTTGVLCAGQHIDDIVVRSSAPTVAMLRRVPVLAHAAAAVHTTTRPQLIRRFLLLRRGDDCNELRRAESERILRAQPFIADARIRVVPNPDGSVDLDVETSDEVAIVAGLAASSHSPPLRFFRLGEANLNGEGIYLAGDWRDGTPFRNGYGGRFVDNQLFGRPYVLETMGHVTPLGSDWAVNSSHPYYTDIQRIAWRANVGASDDYVQFQNDINSSHALRLVRNYFDVGGIVRVGPPGRLSLFGASISGDDERPGTEQVLVTRDGFARDTSSKLLGRYVNHRIARINALWGVRDIGFAAVRGFDAMTATQDLPIGFQLGTMFGRSLTVLGSRDDDIFMGGDVYVGAVGKHTAVRIQMQGEGRRSNDTNAWDGILASSRAVEYLKFSSSNTSTLSLEFSGGWRQRIPFNLSFSDREGGLRGYASSDTPGGQRFVARLEDRQYVGQPFNLGDFGVGAFADAGRLWAGDVPYGVNTPVRASTGLSLFGAVPAGSARMWRVDVAYALKPEVGGHRFELRLTNTNKTSFFLPEPRDIAATRERSIPSSVFRWP
jgi:hypothetical protein